MTATKVFVTKADLAQLRYLSPDQVKAEILERARTLFNREGRTVTLEHEVGQRFSLRSMIDSPATDVTGSFLAEMPLRHLLIWVRRQVRKGW